MPSLGKARILGVLFPDAMPDRFSLESALCVDCMGEMRALRCYKTRPRTMFQSSKRRRGRARKAGQLTSQRPRKGIIMNVARSINAWRKYRQTVNELGRMTNRELNDLGIARDDIHRIARASAAV
jgi:uncharacterized protein YjiS (DUF1127 family)